MTSVNGTLPTHGNYHNYHGRVYYNHHAGPHDSRLALLPPELLAGARVLDIGCNEGWVSCEVAQSWAARRVVGVDIDDVLVRMAWKRRRTLWSHQEPPRDAPPPDASSSKKRKRKQQEDVALAPVPRADYFPASCQHMFGPLPIPPVDVGGADAFPHNVSFRCADWVNEVIPEDAGGYDVILAFSVSKWIHLNGGDDGLHRFFRRVHDALTQGGTFVFEPQQWDSYTKARKLHPVQNAKKLQLHPDIFQDVLRGIGFGPARRLGAPGEGSEYLFCCLQSMC
ncbi:Bin3-domain-containing protein [Artomyces pyxidatus]|uniref:Bin3-domain-containing protein n=1 Tax=Artomyces pyxidatus TaxID=48021 RepID=A0ACB8TB85_9AGAM|nr:Bin3-domain-containing protein [Artomyces pyxidatus]